MLANVITDTEITMTGDDLTQEKVIVTSDDANATVIGDKLVTTVSGETLSSATDELELNGNIENGYKIVYKCTAENKYLRKQDYKGKIQFIVAP